MGSYGATGSFVARILIFCVSLINIYYYNLQMIMQEQDKTIDSISGTMQTLTEQAGLMGQEINEHNEYV